MIVSTDPCPVIEPVPDSLIARIDPAAYACETAVSPDRVAVIECWCVVEVAAIDVVTVPVQSVATYAPLDAVVPAVRSVDEMTSTVMAAGMGMP